MVQGWGTSGAGSGAAVLAGTTAAGGGGGPSPGPPALHAWETTGLTGAVLEGKVQPYVVKAGCVAYR